MAREETLDELIERARRQRGATGLKEAVTPKPTRKPKKPKKKKKTMFQKLLEGDLSR